MKFCGCFLLSFLFLAVGTESKSDDHDNDNTNNDNDVKIEKTSQNIDQTVEAEDTNEENDSDENERTSRDETKTGETNHKTDADQKSECRKTVDEKSSEDTNDVDSLNDVTTKDDVTEGKDINKSEDDGHFHSTLSDVRNILNSTKADDEDEDTFVSEEKNNIDGETGDNIADGGEKAEMDLSLINSLKNTMDGVLESIGGKQPCFFQCPNGAEPVANPSHVSKSNGCDSIGVEIDVGKVPGIAKCCEKHDTCYNTCNSKKDDCDVQFKECLLSMCDALHEFVPEDAYKGCTTAGEIMYSGTLAVGCTPYKDAQRNACSCSVKNTEL